MRAGLMLYASQKAALEVAEVVAVEVSVVASVVATRRSRGVPLEAKGTRIRGNLLETSKDPSGEARHGWGKSDCIM
jgi:hypothetical protein